MVPTLRATVGFSQWGRLVGIFPGLTVSQYLSKCSEYVLPSVIQHKLGAVIMITRWNCCLPGALEQGGRPF